jgi:flagellar biosynthesis anti-sigma factor FlgM
MEVRNSSLNGNLDGINVNLSANLSSVLDVSEPASSSAYGQTDGAASTSDASWLEPDWATLSTVGSTVAQSVTQAAGSPGVREDKVAAVRSSIAAGTYNVTPSAVAGRAVDAMLSAAA